MRREFQMPAEEVWETPSWEIEALLKGLAKEQKEHEQ
jgi:hypothetical protein